MRFEAALFGAGDNATAVALLLAAAALLALPTVPRVDVDSRKAVPGRPGSPLARMSTSMRSGLLAAAAVGVAGIVLAPGLWWIVVPIAGLTGLLFARLPTGLSAAQRAADRSLVAVHAELLASCLDAGMAVGPALRAVSDVMTERDSDAAPTGQGRGGPLAVLDAVAAMLALGAEPGTAWRIADLDDDLAPLAAAARRSAAGGGGLAQAVREHAAQLRQQTAAASVRAAGRAGVLMTAPLGVCFLPAFLCLGLAPVVVGLLGQLDIF